MSFPSSEGLGEDLEQEWCVSVPIAIGRSGILFTLVERHHYEEGRGSNLLRLRGCHRKLEIFFAMT
mgnify:CR=1